MARAQMRLDEETAPMVEKVRQWQKEQGIDMSEAGAARMLVKWGFRDWERMKGEGIAKRKAAKP